MFGQPRPAFGAGTTGFGTSFGQTSTTTSGFGSNFGKPAFGNTTTSFGASSTPFGTATSTPSLFGTQTQPQSGSLFGQGQTTSTGFGSTSGGGLFSQPQSTGAGLFGSTPSTGFGQNKPFGFGSAAATTSASTTGGGIFGTTQPATGGLFNTSTGFGAQGAAVSGTTIKYDPPTGTDTMNRSGVSTNIRTRIEVISSMKEYENKSLEELRVEDYLANRKGPGQGTTMPGFNQTTQPGQQGAGLFGAAPGSSLFSANKPATENKSLFGTATSTGFGTSTTGSLFSTSTPAFGAQPTTSSTGFSFGQNTQQKPGFNFGNTPTSTQPLFGTATSQPSSFGGLSSGFQFGQNTSQANTGGLFGNQNKSLFSSQPATGGLFGNKPAGTAAPLGGSTFGANPTPFGTTPTTSAGGGLFGAQPAQNKPLFSNFGSTGFGQTTSLFGQNTNKAGGITFGNTGFGAPNSMGQPLGTSPGGVGLFNQGGTAATSGTMGMGTGLAGFGFPQQQNVASGGMAFPDIGKLVKAITEKPLFDLTPTKKPSSSQTGGPSSSSADQTTSPKLANGTLRPTYVLSPTLFANNRPKPKPIKKANNQGSDRHWLFKGLDDPTEETTDDLLKPKKYPSVRKLNLRVFRAATSESSSTTGSGIPEVVSPSPLTSPISPLRGVDTATPLRIQPPSHDASPTPDIIHGRDKLKHCSTVAENRQSNSMDDTYTALNVHQIGAAEEEEEEAREKEVTQPVADTGPDTEGGLSGENKENEVGSDMTGATKYIEPHPAGIKLTLSEYYILPSLDDLKEMVESDGTCCVENLTVGRYGYGNVCFLGVTEIAGLDFDNLISIYRKQVEVYPEGTQKPPQGQGLNKPAIVTLDCVWPVDKTTRQLIKVPERLQAMGWAQYLERQCVKMDTSFIEYRPSSGSWVFKVKHFSKYGLSDEAEDDMDAAPADGVQQVIQSGPLGMTKTIGGGASAFLPPISMRPPVTALSSPAQFKSPLGATPVYTTKTLQQPRFLDSPAHLEECPIMEDEYIDSTLAKEPDESAAAMNILSPSAERLTMASKAVPRAVQITKMHMFMEDDDEPLQDIINITAPPNLEAVRAVTKKLMMGYEARPVSPVVDDLSAAAATKVRVFGKSQSLNIGSPPKTGISTEPCLTTFANDPRSEYEILPSGKDVGREIGHVAPQHQAEFVCFSDSIVRGQDRYLADMGAFKGRSFRVGWGPGGSFVHGGKKLALCHKEFATEMEKGDQSDAIGHQSPSVSFLYMGSEVTQPKATTTKSAESLSYKLIIEKLHAERIDPTKFDHVTEAFLNDIWQYSTMTTNQEVESDDHCPYFHPLKEKELLHQLAHTASSAGEDHFNTAEIFNLCVALWGDLSFCMENDGESDYSQSRARVEAVSQWLENSNSFIVEQEVAYSLNQENDENYLPAIFAHLTARQISEACLLAQSNGDHHLALLLAQSCFGEESPRQFLAQQLNNWAEGGTDILMSESRLVLYALLAASPTHQASQTTINTCQGLDWKRAFGLHLWYVCPATATIAEALQEYDKAAGLEGDAPSYCERPLPAYLTNSNYLTNGVSDKYDVCYHLLKLFTDQTHRLELLLNTSTVTADPLDDVVSWLLWRVLESLGYQHLSEQLSTHLHLSMASLLEVAGQWHWATFVLLNVVNEARRTKEVKALLNRHIVVGKDTESEPKYNAKESFLVKDLHIPLKWIHQAKATKARILNMTDEEAWYLLKAGSYNEAHTLIIDTIAPNSIVNEDHDYLKGYLDQFSNDDIKSGVVDWTVGGGIYADYLDVCCVVEEMKLSGDPTPAQLEHIRPRLLALCSGLNNLKCSSATHRLCVSEMSRVVVGVLRAVVGEGADASQVLSQQLSGLPLTHDYALTELNLVTEHYLAHLAAAE